MSWSTTLTEEKKAIRNNYSKYLKGDMSIQTGKQFTFAEIKEALEHGEKHATRGKVLLTLKWWICSGRVSYKLLVLGRGKFQWSQAHGNRSSVKHICWHSQRGRYNWIVLLFLNMGVRLLLSTTKVCIEVRNVICTVNLLKSVIFTAHQQRAGY